MSELWWSRCWFTPGRAESGSAGSGCLPHPSEPEMAKFGLFACSVWNNLFTLVLSESLARNCISCGPYAGSCKDLTQRCKSVSWWGTGGFSDTLFFPPFVLLWGWVKKKNTTPFCHFRDVYIRRNQFLLCGCDQRRVEIVPELGCSVGQSPTEKSPEVSGSALSGSEMIRESDRSHSSRRDHPHPKGAVEAWKSFCLCVCVWACNLGATRAGLSFGALKAKAKPPTRGWSSAGQGWLGAGGGATEKHLVLPSSHRVPGG